MTLNWREVKMEEGCDEGKEGQGFSGMRDGCCCQCGAELELVASGER